MRSLQARLFFILLVISAGVSFSGCAATRNGATADQDYSVAKKRYKDSIAALSYRTRTLATHYASGPSDPQSIGDAVVSECEPEIEQAMKQEDAFYVAMLTRSGNWDRYTQLHVTRGRPDRRRKTEQLVHRLAVSTVVKIRSGSGPHGSSLPTSRPSSSASTSDKR